MACFRIRGDDDGYATPLAMAMCLAMSLSVSALMTAATSDLQLARRDMDREQAEYALSGEQALAAVVIAQSRGGGHLQWSLSVDRQPVEVVAEAQGQKLSYAAAAEMSAGVFQAMNVSDLEDLRARLRARSDEPPADRRLADIDRAQLWAVCGPALVSRYGAADRLVLVKPTTPQAAVSAAASRTGELWRVRVSSGGWVDERTVRFTGDQRRPAAVVERRFYRGQKVGGRCDAVFDAATAD